MLPRGVEPPVKGALGRAWRIIRDPSSGERRDSMDEAASKPKAERPRSGRRSGSVSC